MTALHRRAFLKGAPAAAAAVAVPTAALAIAPSADAELIRLGREFDAFVEKADAISEESHRLHVLAHERWHAERSELLRFRPEDKEVHHLVEPEADENGERWYSLRYRHYLDSPVAGCRIGKDDEIGGYGGIIFIGAPESRARADELVIAIDEDWALLAAIERENGRNASDERYNAVMREIQVRIDVIQPMPAYTLQGIAVKARVARFFAVPDMGDEHDPGEDLDKSVVASLIRAVLSVSGAVT